MTSPSSHSWAKPAIRIAAAGLGAAVAGPLGGALGGWLAGALGESAAHLVEGHAERFGAKAGEKLLDTIADSLAGKLKEPALSLADVYREALRLSLAQIHEQNPYDGFADWFDNWEQCLTAGVPLNLAAIAPDQLLPEKLDGLFRLTMESLDAQGTALRQNDSSLLLKPRTMEGALLSELTTGLPDRLQQNFGNLIREPANDRAWKQIQLIFQAV